MPVALLVLLFACRSDSVDGPWVTDGFNVAPLQEAVPLQRGVSFQTSEPTVATWTLSAGEHQVEWVTPEAQNHDTTLLGLRPDRVYLSTVRLDGPSGSRTVKGPEVQSGPLPDSFPAMDVLAWEPDRVEPGFTLVNLTVIMPDSDDITHVVLMDEALEPVWLLSTTTVGYLRWEDGVWAITSGLGLHWSLDGQLDVRLTAPRAPDPMPELDVPLDLEGQLHYDLLPTGRDSFWSIAFSSFDVEDYPLSVDEPEVVPNPQTLRDVHIVELGFDGTQIQVWPLSERLDPGRISYSSFDPSPDGYDWAHCNAVNHNPDGGVIVSSRHQDAVVALDEDGDLQWILSNPDGWSEPYASRRLQPIGDVSWPSHQHAPHFADDHLLVMFDNGNYRSTPYQPLLEPEPLHTRVVGYHVDSDAMTVEELWSFRDTVTGSLYSRALGDADPQPVTGNVLATYSMVREEEGVRNEDLGRGKLTVRLIEFEPNTLQSVLDLRFSTPLASNPGGLRSFRSDRVAPEQVPWRVLD